MKRININDFLLADDWCRIGKFAQEYYYPDATAIIDKHDDCDQALLVKEGHVQLIIEDQTHIIDRLGEREIIGELPFIDGHKATATLLVECGARLVAISYSDLTKLFRESIGLEDRFYQYLAHVLAERLRRSRQIISKMICDRPAKSFVHDAPIYEIGRFTFRALSSPSEISDAMALLHDVYVIEQDWKIIEHNPSQLRVEYSEDHRLLLVDKYVKKAS